MVVASRSGTESHRAEPLDDWEALRWRELEWSDLPKTMYRGLISCLTVREAGRLDCAMTNREARLFTWSNPTRACSGTPCFQWVRVRVQGQGMQGAAVGEEEGHRLERLHDQLRWGCPIGLCAVEADGRKLKG